MAPLSEAIAAKILIVDDQSSNVRLLELALRRGGYLAVSTTTDPTEVASLHGEHHYDLILLDLQMPRMNGYEVIEALRLVGEVAPVTVLVLSADPSQRLPSLEAGAADFLSKPFKLTDVVTRSHRLLERVIAGGDGPLVQLG